MILMMITFSDRVDGYAQDAEELIQATQAPAPAETLSNNFFRYKNKTANAVLFFD